MVSAVIFSQMGATVILEMIPVTTRTLLRGLKHIIDPRQEILYKSFNTISLVFSSNLLESQSVEQYNTY